jgi:Domain of Unknown Function (DUF1259)
MRRKEFWGFRGSRRLSLAIIAAIWITSVLQGQSAGAVAQTSDWSAVEQALGRKGTLNPGDVMKFSFPRSDLSVTLAGVQLRPALALGSWVAFKRMGGARTMVMGDLVLTQDEVAPVMQRLQDLGVEQTALHNHLLMESPRVMYMHIMAQGDEAKIARALHDALALSKTPLAAPLPQTSATGFDLDTAAIARELGVAGKVNGGVYQVSVPRRETITEGGNEVPPSMGVATAINFQPTGGATAAITGDFVLRASEVNPVIRALRSNGIAVTAVHSHMIEEEPRLFFMHFWANDDAKKLAHGLRAALDQTASRM